MQKSMDHPCCQYCEQHFQGHKGCHFFVKEVGNAMIIIFLLLIVIRLNKNKQDYGPGQTSNFQMCWI